MCVCVCGLMCGLMCGPEEQKHKKWLFSEVTPAPYFHLTYCILKELIKSWIGLLFWRAGRCYIQQTLLSLQA